MTDYEALKVLELKALLKDRSLSIAGRKADLIDRLKESDSRNDPEKSESVKVSASDDDADAIPADAEQPQHSKHNGDADGVNDVPGAQGGESATGAVASVKGTLGNDEGQPEQEASQAETHPVCTVDIDTAKQSAKPPAEQQIPGSSADALDAEHSKGDLPTQDGLPPGTEGPEQEISKIDAATVEKCEAVTASAPEQRDEVGKVADQHEDSDSLSLNDSESEHDGKADAHGFTDNGAAAEKSVATTDGGAEDRKEAPATIDSTKVGQPPDPPGDNVLPPGEGPEAAAQAPPVAKRKHAAIVFPDSGTQAERPAPTKREKVELVVPEATDETRALRISGLKRPLREMDLKKILSETGTIEGFWIDSCKTHCYVIYETVDQAKATWAAVNGREWPPRCRSVMRPKYVADVEAQGMIDSKGAAMLTRVPSTSAPGVADAHETDAAPKVDGKPEEKALEHSAGVSTEPVIDLTKAAPRVPRRDASQIAAGGSAPPELAPSELFNLTEATPSLYWLPLSDEQVAQRRSVDAARRARAAAAVAAASPDARNGAAADDGAAVDGEKVDARKRGEGVGIGDPVSEAGRGKAEDDDVEMADHDEDKLGDEH